jgi:lipoprotein-releasing system permease protein
VSSLSSFIAQRIALGRKNSFSATIVRVAIAAVALSVAVMIVGISLVKGFQEGVKNKFYENWGHIHVTPYLADPNHYLQEEKVLLNDSLQKEMMSYDNVERVVPFALQSVIIKSREEMEGIILKSSFKSAPNTPTLTKGNPIQFTDSGYSNNIVLAQSLANKLKVKLNDKIRFYFLLPNNATPVPRKGIVSGIFETGLQEFDNQIAFCDHELIMNVNKDSVKRIQGYEVYVKDLSKIEETKENIYTDLIEPPLFAYTIRERFENIFSWLGMMKTNERLIIGIMIIVAIMNMISTMLILILERTQMIGVLKSLGMHNTKLSKVFYASGLRILSIGLLLGNALGLLFIFLQTTFGFIQLNPEVYYVSTAPVVYAWSAFLFINILVILTMLFVLLIPTIIIRNIKPVKALQFK